LLGHRETVVALNEIASIEPNAATSVSGIEPSHPNFEFAFIIGPNFGSSERLGEGRPDFGCLERMVAKQLVNDPIGVIANDMNFFGVWNL
jgi:hypothetical protein